MTIRKSGPVSGKHRAKTLTIMILSIMMCLSFIPCVYAADETSAENRITLTFEDSGITETGSGSGFTIDGTSLEITSAGTYTITGSCSEGNIVVDKGLSDVILIFRDLNLTSSTTAPVVVKKKTSAVIHLDGSSTLTDNEDASTEDTNSDFEGAAIKVKSSSSVSFCGDGSLTIKGNAKNGIKGAAAAALTFQSGNYHVTAVNNGIASDGSLVFNSGTYTVEAGSTSSGDGDAIKSVPESTDTESEGRITINGGSFNINAGGEGIQADAALTITNGSFDIQTLNGYQSSNFNEDTMSCKGLKASGDRELDNELTISGGNFTINAADDAVHSDANAKITGGTFDIYTGDDGIHADVRLDLGAEGGCERDPEITIHSSYEGLEAGNVYIYCGKYYVIASDDGINSAGGSSSGSDPGAGGGNSFRPGGNHGSPGGSQSGSNYNIYISGGDVYVNCNGDGLDSNGGLYLTGGNITVLSMRGGGDNSPVDADGTMSISGATFFGAGSRGMIGGMGSQDNSYRSWSASYSSGTVLNVKNGNTTLYSERLTKNVSYIMYADPSVSSNSLSLSAGSSVDSCHSNAWQHNWDSGVVEEEASADSSGLMKYTCSDCGDTEYKTIAFTQAYDCGGHEDAGETVEYAVSYEFQSDDGSNLPFEVSVLIPTDPDLYADGTDVTALSPSATSVAAENGSWIFKGWDAESKKISGSDITFTGTWTFLADHDCPSAAFSDLNLDAWYHEAADYVLSKGYFNGTSKSFFEPDSDMTRAMFVTVLSRMEGIDAADYTDSSFDDVETGCWYSAAVRWASEKGIVLGISENEFDPEGKVTREQMATIMYRYAKYKGIDVSDVNSTKYNSFSDTGDVSDWAVEALTWAADRGIINGMGNGTIAPQNPSTRVQVAQIIKNYTDAIA